MTTSKTKKLVIFGTKDLAQIVHEYFTHDSEYEVAGFTVDKEYIEDRFLDMLNVVPFEEVESYFPPEEYDMYIAIVYDDMNRMRAKKAGEAKEKGYDLASYVSSKAFVSQSAKLGESVTVFENNVVQPFVTIGDNTILWSGNHVGHHSRLGKNVFVSSHVVISGHCDIGDNCFLGVNCTIPNATKIGKESWVMHGAVIPGDIAEHSLVRNLRADSLPLNEAALARSLERKKS